MSLTSQHPWPFFETAVGFTRRCLHGSGTYGELATGGTTLSFAAHALAETNFGCGPVAPDSSPLPLGMEVGFVCDDVPAAHAHAVAASAREMAAPHKKLWGRWFRMCAAPTARWRSCARMQRWWSGTPNRPDRLQWYDGGGSLTGGSIGPVGGGSVMGDSPGQGDGSTTGGSGTQMGFGGVSMGGDSTGGRCGEGGVDGGGWIGGMGWGAGTGMGMFSI